MKKKQKPSWTGKSRVFSQPQKAAPQPMSAPPATAAPAPAAPAPEPANQEQAVKAKLLSGREVAEALNRQTSSQLAALKADGIVPKLAIVQVGEDAENAAYAKNAVKRLQGLGLAVQHEQLPAADGEAALLAKLAEINQASDIHGCLLLQPLPAGFDRDRCRNALAPEKDVDGITDAALAAVFVGQQQGFPPCTAAACLEMLDYYQVALSGKRVVVVGRSLVVGKPLSMLLLARDATVTICHSRSQRMAAICREADVLIVAAGQAELANASFFTPQQTILDVGINATADGSIVGDVDFGYASQIAAAVSPVPGGVGTVTTAVLAKHLCSAAQRQQAAAKKQAAAQPKGKAPKAAAKPAD